MDTILTYKENLLTHLAKLVIIKQLIDSFARVDTKVNLHGTQSLKTTFKDRYPRLQNLTSTETGVPLLHFLTLAVSV